MPDATTSTTAAIYTRISRDPEGERVGVDRQEVDCRKLAADLGLSVAHVYSDNDAGASNRTNSAKVRHGYNRLLADAQAGRFAHILAYSNSRLTRRLAELQGLVDLSRNNGVVIHTVADGRVDLATADGLMIANILASVDAGEADRISERQKVAFRHKALKGEPKLHRQRPFGWQADGKTLEPEEAGLVRAAVAKIIDGASITTIRREWEAAGVRTAAGGATWEWSVLQRVLLGWRTAGVRTYEREPLYGADGQLVMGTWTPIITLDERDAALTMLKKRSLRKERQGTWLLTGLVRCGDCGGPMYGQLKSGKNISTYACKPGNGHVAITADKLEWYVEAQVVHRVLRRAEDAAYAQGYEPSPTAAVWPGAERLVTVTSKIGELMEAFRLDRLPGSVVFAQVDLLQQEQKDLERDRQLFEAQKDEASGGFSHSFQVWNTVGDTWATMPTAAKTDFFRNELQAVVVKKGKRGRDGWGAASFEERLSFVWRDALAVRALPATQESRRMPDWPDTSGHVPGPS